MGFCAYASSSALLHRRRSHLRESSIFVYSHCHFHHRKACQAKSEIAFAMHGVAFSSDCLFLAAMNAYRFYFWDIWLLISSGYRARLLFCLWRTWLPVREWLLLVWVVFTLLSRNLPFSSFRSRSGLGKLPYYWDLAGSSWWEPTWWGPDPTMPDRCPY